MEHEADGMLCPVVIKGIPTMIGRDIYEKLMREIAAGKFAKVGKLPSESKLANTFGVARMTVRGALAELQRQGLIETRNGAGSFLTQRARRKSGIIGLVIPNFEAFEFFADIRDELERHCKRLNYTVQLVFTREHGREAAIRDIRRKVRELAVARAEGVIFRPYVAEEFSAANREVVRIFQRTEIPVVLIDSDITRPPERSDCDLVAVNNIEAGRRIADYLHQRGHRHIAFLGERRTAAHNVNWDNRLFGLAGELALLGSADGVRTLDFGPTDKRALASALRGKNRVDAIVCGNDESAVAIVETLRKIGKRVPDDVAVVGFDDIARARTFVPPLTTISQPVKKIAATAFKTLLARIRYPNNDPREIFLTAPLIARQSA